MRAGAGASPASRSGARPLAGRGVSQTCVQVRTRGPGLSEKRGLPLRPPLGHLGISLDLNFRRLGEEETFCGNQLPT